MSVEKLWAHFFKPEIRKQGEDLLAKSSVTLSQGTDTQILCYVRSSTPAKVSFLAGSIADEAFSADCSCTTSAKGQLCKHIWAALLLVEEKYPDFLDSKTTFEKGNSLKKPSAAPKESPLQAAYKEAQKTKQADYRKEQYQKQKERLKQRSREEKQDKKSSSRHHASAPSPELPEDVELALKYFAENGFELRYPIDVESLKSAKKILSRVFHPDKGGSHEEILALNHNFDVLSQFAELS